MTRKVVVWVFVAIATVGLMAAALQTDLAWAAAWLGYGVVGGMILTRRPGNAIGWLLLGIGLAWAIDFIIILALERIEAPWAVWLEMVGNSLGYTAWLLMIMIPVLFPTGRLPDRFNRLLSGAVVVGLVAVVLSEFLTSAPKATTGQVGPLAVPALAGITDFILNDGFIIDPLFLLLALGGLVMRWRRSSGIERLQYRWLVVALAFVILGLLGLAYLPSDWLPDSWALVLIILILNSIPIAIGIAVLRYRLYGIDLVINRSVLFLLLAGFITGVYALIVVGLGRWIGAGNDLTLSIVATGVIALAFEPVRLRAQRWADRVAYGNRATPYEVLSDLTERLSTAESAEGLFNRTAQRLADGTGAERACVWVAAEGGLLLAGQWPSQGGEPMVASWEDLVGTVVEIEAEGERLGALTVEKRRGDPVTSTEQRLMDDLAGSSAPLLKNLGLQAELGAKAADLVASRRRLVEVQSVERRRLERDLDEGAQQLVVSLKVKLNVATRLARIEEVEPLAEMLEGMDQEARVAINQIRSLARGLYPQLLEEEGLAAAVRSLAEVAPVPVQVETDPLERLPADLEATAYFVISEAITNAAKHAPGLPVTINLTQQNSHLVFTVTDQGPGFDPQTVELGSGLRNMADRLDAHNGQLHIDTTPGQGTTIQAKLPLPERVSA